MINKDNLLLCLALIQWNFWLRKWSPAVQWETTWKKQVGRENTLKNWQKGQDESRFLNDWFTYSYWTLHLSVQFLQKSDFNRPNKFKSLFEARKASVCGYNVHTEHIPSIIEYLKINAESIVGHILNFEQHNVYHMF